MEPCSSFEEHRFLDDGLCRNCGRSDGSHAGESGHLDLIGSTSLIRSKRPADVDYGQLPIVDKADGAKREWLKTPASSSTRPRIDLQTSPDEYCQTTSGVSDSPLMTCTSPSLCHGAQFDDGDDGQFALVYDKYENTEGESRDICTPLDIAADSQSNGNGSGQTGGTSNKLTLGGESNEDDEFSLVYNTKPPQKGLRITNLLDNTTEIIDFEGTYNRYSRDGSESNTATTSRQLTPDLSEIVAAKDLEIETLKKQNEELRERKNLSHQGFRRVSGKVIIVGSAAVGKTSLVNRFIHEHFGDTIPTIGCDSFSKSVRVDDAVVNLLIYDTAGQERFAGLTTQYFRLGDVCLICCDLSVEDCITRGRVEWWRHEVKGQNPQCAVVLVGTKVDLAIDEEKRRASEFAQKINVPFYLTSAKSNLLGGLFYHVGECCLRRHAEKGIEEATLRLNRSKPKARNESCC